MQVVVGLMRDCLDIERPAQLTPADLEELLLRVYPRKITVLDAADAVGTVPAVRDFVTYLAGTGELTRPQADELEHTLQAIAPRFAAAVMEPGNWGMARSFLTMMAAEGVDLDDAAAVQHWIADYNARLDAAFDEDVDDGEDPDLGAGLKEAFGLPDVLPPVKLPPDAELAAAARQAPVVTKLKSLTGWLGDSGREVDEDWELVPGDASAAVNAAGVEPGELPYLWDTAAESDFIYFDEGEEETVRAFRGEVAQEWEGYDDVEMLDAWRTLSRLSRRAFAARIRERRCGSAGRTHGAGGSHVRGCRLDQHRHADRYGRGGSRCRARSGGTCKAARRRGSAGPGGAAVRGDGAAAAP